MFKTKLILCKWVEKFSKNNTDLYYMFHKTTIDLISKLFLVSLAATHIFAISQKSDFFDFTLKSFSFGAFVSLDNCKVSSQLWRHMDIIDCLFLNIVFFVSFSSQRDTSKCVYLSLN